MQSNSAFQITVALTVYTVRTKEVDFLLGTAMKVMDSVVRFHQNHAPEDFFIIFVSSMRFCTGVTQIHPLAENKLLLSWSFLQVCFTRSPSSDWIFVWALITATWQITDTVVLSSARFIQWWQCRTQVCCCLPAGDPYCCCLVDAPSWLEAAASCAEL